MRLNHITYMRLCVFVGCETTGLYSAVRDRQDQAGAARAGDTDGKKSGK
jgi:hypothetical protein